MFRTSSASSKSRVFDLQPEKLMAMPVLERAMEVANSLKTRFGDHMARVCELEPKLRVPVRTISTSSIALDRAMGGGIPTGKISEIYGPESAGKTTLVLHLIQQAQAQDKVCAFIDAEFAFDPSYAEAIGIHLEQLILCRPEHAEQALEVVDAMLRTGGVGLVVVDSVAALIPKVELDGEMGELHVGMQARLMNQAMRKLSGIVQRTGSSLVFVNQLRQPVAASGEDREVTPGGNALRHQASLRVEMRPLDRERDREPDRKREQELERDDEEFSKGSLHVQVKITKNKLASPYSQAKLEIEFGKGISREADRFELAIQEGLVISDSEGFCFGERWLGPEREAALLILRNEPPLLRQLEQSLLERSSSSQCEENAEN